MQKREGGLWWCPWRVFLKPRKTSQLHISVQLQLKLTAIIKARIRTKDDDEADKIERAGTRAKVRELNFPIHMHCPSLPCHYSECLNLQWIFKMETRFLIRHSRCLHACLCSLSPCWTPIWKLSGNWFWFEDEFWILNCKIKLNVRFSIIISKKGLSSFPS